MYRCILVFARTVMRENEVTGTEYLMNLRELAVKCYTHTLVETWEPGTYITPYSLALIFALQPYDSHHWKAISVLISSPSREKQYSYTSTHCFWLSSSISGTTSCVEYFFYHWQNGEYVPCRDTVPYRKRGIVPQISPSPIARPNNKTQPLLSVLSIPTATTTVAPPKVTVDLPAESDSILVSFNRVSQSPVAISKNLSAATKLKKMIEDTDELIVCPGVYDGLSARIALRVGFSAMYMVRL